MIRFALTALLLLAAAPALAWTACEDLWFSRNQLYDRAGYCFVSALGQAVFDNSGCTGSEVALEPGGDELVAYIREREAVLECDVDTSASGLAIPNISLRQRLEQVVALSEYASGCLGWTGDAILLRAGPRFDAEVVSVAMPGDDLTWEYEPIGWPDGWAFLTAYRGQEQVGLGWMESEIDYDLCTGLAG